MKTSTVNFLLRKHFFILSFIILAWCEQNNLNAQATPIFSQDFESSWTAPGTLSPAWSGTATTGTQWHRNDYTTGWTSGGSGAYSPTGACGSTYSARFHSYGISSGTSSDLITPAMDFSCYPTTMKKFLSFYMINTSGGAAEKLNVYLSTDGGTTYGATLGTFTFYTKWTPIFINLGTTNSATVKIKFTATSDDGLTDIGIDNVQVYAGEFFTITNTWTKPSGIANVFVECWGGGGAGGSARAKNTNYFECGGGGAGGSYSSGNVDVSASSSYTVTVATAVTGTTSTTNGTVVNGDPSWFSSAATLYAQGGAGAPSLYYTTNGSFYGNGGAGTSAGCIGTTKYAGGSGAAGLDNTASFFAGGSGSSAGYSAVGGNADASDQIGGVPPNGGGYGADGPATFNISGNTGFFPGGGGSGAVSNSTTYYQGGAGAAGLVLIKYILSVLSAPVITTTTICSGSSVTVSGTSSNNGATITIYKNGTTVLGITTVSGSAWSLGGLTLVGGDIITAKVSSNSCNASAASNGVTVGTTLSSVATAPLPATGATGICYSGAGAVTAITWASAPGATSYDVYFGAGSLPGTITVNISTNSWIISPALIANTTYYWKIVPRNSCGITTGPPTVWNFTTTNAPCYCTPTHTTNIAANTITLVEFVGTLNDISNNSGTANQSAYQDFTGLASRASQEQGEAVNLNVYANTASTYWRAWVDWNQDGDFTDAGEEVYTSGNIATISTTFGFQIPSNKPPGNYRIRIRTQDYVGCAGLRACGANTLDPCSNLANGQAEDYLFTVTARCDARIASIANDDECSSTGTTTSFALSATGTAGTTGFKWYTAQTGGSLVSNSGNTTFTAIPSPTGTFNFNTTNTTTYWVSATNATCESPSRVPVIADFRPIPSAITFTPSNPAYLCSGSSVQVGGGASTETAYLINEGFENTSIPLGEFTVSVTNNTNAEQKWQLRTSTFTPTSTAVWRPAISSGFGADRFITALGNDASSSNTMVTTLTSVAHNTTGFTNLILDFRIYYDHYLVDNSTDATDNINVQAYDGTAWNNLLLSRADIGKASNMATLTYNLGSQYLNKTNMQIRFIYNAQLNGSDGVAIDSVRLYGDHPTTGNYVWTQTGGFIDNCLYLDAAFTMPYMSGIPATKVYVKPTNPQQEDGTPLVFKADLTLSNGCTASGNLTVNIDNKRWIGSLSNDWNDGNNWCGGQPPVISDRVTIPNLTASGGSYPVIKNTPVAKSRFLTIDPGASVTINEGFTLQVRRDLFTDVGATFTNNGTLALVGQNAGSDNANHDPQIFPGPGTVAEMNNLVIGNTTNVVSTGGINVQLDAPISLRGRLRDSAGILALGNYDITLKSRVSATAYVDVVEAGFGFNYNGTGRFVVERYFPGVRAWRFIAVPFSSSGQTINDAWQEGKVYCDYSSCSSSTWNGTPGFGTEITYNNNCGAGFDYHNNNYKTSIQTYQSNAWVTPGSTYSNFATTPSSLNPGSPGYPAYALFVRGDRTVCLSYEAPAMVTTLRPKGILNEDGNNVSHALPSGNAGDYILIGNPYACTIKLDDALYNRSSSNINKNNFWTYNPNAGTTGGYITYSLTSGTNVPYIGTPTPYIQSGQAFMVQLKNAGTPTFDFRQSDKLPGQAQINSGVFGLRAAETEQAPSLVYINLIDTVNAVLDGVAAAFGNQYSAAVDDVDATKKWNEEIENMAIIRHDTALAIEFRPMPKASDTLFFRLYLRQQPYRLKVFSQNLSPAFSSKAWIVDKYLGTETEVNLRDTGIYDFTPNSDTMSYRNRFELVFSPVRN